MQVTARDFFARLREKRGCTTPEGTMYIQFLGDLYPSKVFEFFSEEESEKVSLETEPIPNSYMNSTKWHRDSLGMDSKVCSIKRRFRGDGVMGTFVIIGLD